MHRSPVASRKTLCTLIGLVATLCGTVLAGVVLDAQVAGPSRPAVFPLDQEIALALSAAPEHLRAEAGVYALDGAEYRRVRDSRNGFTCIVNRDAPLAIKPTCYDAEGTATILPKVLEVGAMLMAGRSEAEIAAHVDDGFRTGRFVAPRRPGVAYMLSDQIVNADFAGRTSTFPPHAMYYAPHLTNADIGAVPAAARADPRLPFVAYEGPHGVMIIGGSAP